MSNDITEIIRRLKQSVEQSGLTYAELEKKTGIAKSSIQRYVQGSTKKIPVDAIQAIANAIGVPDAYIMGWDDNSDNCDNQILRIKDETIVMRPLYNSVAAGFGAVPQNNVVGYIPTNIKVVSEKDLYIWITVDGDSMAPTIEDGSEILVRKQSSVDSGQIAVVLIDGDESVVKKVVYGEDWIELHSINPYYPPRRFEGAEVQRISVLGLVKKVSMTLN